MKSGRENEPRSEHRQNRLKTLDLKHSLKQNQDIDTRRNRFQIAAVERYWLESSVFNVSTAFIGPYLDWGKWGIWLAAFTLGILCSTVFSTFHSMEGLAGIVILTTACLLSVYADSFTNLNFIGQFAWLVLLMLIANVYRSMARRRSA